MLVSAPIRRCWARVRRVAAIAFNTYRESVRARIFLGLAGVAFAIAFYSLFVGELPSRRVSRGEPISGAASISIYCIARRVIIGATSLYRELEQKTIFPILARPIHRAEYLVGKYARHASSPFGVFIVADAGLVLRFWHQSRAASDAEIVIGSAASR